MDHMFVCQTSLQLDLWCSTGPSLSLIQDSSSYLMLSYNSQLVFLRCWHSTSIYLKRIRTEKINKVTHRSESSQPILRHRERRSTSPLLYHFTSLLPTPLTVLSHHPPLLQSSYSGCLKGRTECTERLRIPPRKDTAHSESLRPLTGGGSGSHLLPLRETASATTFYSATTFEQQAAPPPDWELEGKLSGTLWRKRWIQIRLNQTAANFVVTAKNF